MSCAASPTSHSSQLRISYDISYRLRVPHIQPSARDLADAGVIEQWRLLSIPHSADILVGSVGVRIIADFVVAVDRIAGWARTSEGWFVLGEKARERPDISIDWNERLRQDPLPHDAEGLLAWAMRNIFD